MPNIFDTSTNQWRALTEDDVGGAGGGGGGGGDASAANQATQIAAATALNTAFGAQADATAADDIGAASLMARIKRISVFLSSIQSRLPTNIGARASAASLSVTQDTDTTWRTRAFQPTTGTGGALALTAATSEALMVPSAATHFAAFCASAATLKWITGTGS